MTERITADEMVESLTGYDEIAIEKHFGHGPFELVSLNKETSLLRALVFVQLRRDGRQDHEAKDEVLGMTLKSVNEYFVTEAEEVTPDEPVTESGKGD